MERAGFKPAPTRGCVVSWGRAVRGALLRGVVLRIGESFGRDWVLAGHLWIPACVGMTGVRAWVVWRFRGLAQGNSLRSLGFARDDNRRARVARALMEWAGLKPAPTRRGVALRGAHLHGSGLRGGGSWVGGLGYTPGSQSIQELDDGDETTASTGAPLPYARLHP